jgi:hypothetical protein
LLPEYDATLLHENENAVFCQKVLLHAVYACSTHFMVELMMAEYIHFSSLRNLPVYV